MLHIATALGRIAIIRLLLEAGLEVNKQEDGETPLTIAMQNQDKEIEKLLLDNGARLDKEPTSRHSPPGGVSEGAFTFRRASTRLAIGEPIGAGSVYVGIHYETHFLRKSHICSFIEFINLTVPQKPVLG